MGRTATQKLPGSPKIHAKNEYFINGGRSGAAILLMLAFA
jgi:hypothetical protein